MTQNHITLLSHIVEQHPLHMDMLKTAHQLQLPDYFLAAGFLRNLVWDYLHDVKTPTPLNDCDLIYYNADDVSSESEQRLENQLFAFNPKAKWQVRNQARMHLKHGDPAYRNSIDAMSYWVEKETAVAVRLTETGELLFVSSFGFDSLFQGKITRNPKRDLNTFWTRVRNKKWLETWPKLQVVD